MKAVQSIPLPAVLAACIKNQDKEIQPTRILVPKTKAFSSTDSSIPQEAMDKGRLLGVMDNVGYRKGSRVNTQERGSTTQER
jgi:hypothetical protein